MKPFESYVSNLEGLVKALVQTPKATKKCSRLQEALNGQPAATLRFNIPLSDRRTGGIFFTGAKLAHRATHKLISEIPSNALIADVGCGAGDLILSCARKLPLGSDLNETLKMWGNYLMGFDIHPEFIRAAKVRLILLAISRGVRIQNSSTLDITEMFPTIRVHDFLSWPKEVKKATHIIINPPYNELAAPSGCTWGNRKVSAAALFMDACISNASPGTKIVAILPDVLRSGSYYEKWRQHIDSMSENIQITTYGQFDKWTDVDVFILRLLKSYCKKSLRTIWWRSIRQPHEGRVGDRFKVHVGAVVPHRNPQKGPYVAYVHAKNLPCWRTIKRIDERCRFSGTLFEPPFVAVRRTSRPGEKRAIATIITGKHKVAVENHLVVLSPNKKTITECKKLLGILWNSLTDQWLNKRIRCRHLTLQALQELPWWSG